MLQSCQTHKPLSELSTLGVGGPARYFLEVHRIEEMQAVLKECDAKKIPFLVIGKGSNCLFDDEGWPGLVILNKINFCQFNWPTVHVGAGYSFSLLGVQTARAGWAGLEFASGIPGSVGGAIFMNAGASGSETFNTVEEVTFVTEKGEMEIFAKDTIEHGYRHSLFHRKKGAIVSATFRLHPSTTVRAKQLDTIAYRTKTQPYQDKSAGCVFRNPQGASAGALIEECDLKGLRFGGAEVSTLHGNFIVNREKATAKEILELAAHVRQVVKEKKGIDLEMEIRYISGAENVSC